MAYNWTPTAIAPATPPCGNDVSKFTSSFTPNVFENGSDDESEDDNSGLPIKKSSSASVLANNPSHWIPSYEEEARNSKVLLFRVIQSVKLIFYSLMP
jgi:hypothetical protein